MLSDVDILFSNEDEAAALVADESSPEVRAVQSKKAPEVSRPIHRKEPGESRTGGSRQQILDRARHGHCRIDHEDLIKPSRHSRIQLSRQFLTDTIYVRVAP
eukprot:6548811-Pyramimonas_sp.AAC.1